jgi:NADH dehydrogenase
MAQQRVTVFGGTGFLGRCVVRHLGEAGYAVRVASRHPTRGRSSPSIEIIRSDVNDDTSVAAAVSGAWAVVNAVSLYVERGADTFRSVHVEAAHRIAAIAREEGSERVVHISGIGADARSSSFYIRCRGEGDAAVQLPFPSATLIRPAVMFGPGDAFVTPLSNMLRNAPAFPLFGRGETRLQPAYVEDVAEAVIRALRKPPTDLAYQLAGPRVYTYAELVKTIARAQGRKAVLIPVPFPLWHAVAFAAEFLPAPPITRSQIQLMQVDNVAAPDAPGFAALGIFPQPLEDYLSRLPI